MLFVFQCNGERYGDLVFPSLIDPGFRQTGLDFAELAQDFAKLDWISLNWPRISPSYPIISPNLKKISPISISPQKSHKKKTL